jgi:hypothetical protein
LKQRLRKFKVKAIEKNESETTTAKRRIKYQRGGTMNNHLLNLKTEISFDQEGQVAPANDY